MDLIGWTQAADWIAVAGGAFDEEDGGDSWPPSEIQGHGLQKLMRGLRRLANQTSKSKSDELELLKDLMRQALKQHGDEDSESAGEGAAAESAQAAAESSGEDASAPLASAEFAAAGVGAGGGTSRGHACCLESLLACRG